ncbi:DcrB-related protein [Paraburkholderia sp. SOS3]|jgi:hypothetical protein|uniref:DcrB-related protein n=1 Tax=Paraburkholderia sp. SOS3 TaxID=1926494 RepID=UPI0009472E66|nr:DcrB-related protein [Paraburkholderia sp. SOS3]APR38897.1 hypothetical protein BTO02_26280 [Paraburkholderia sp. SOS3]
MKYFTHECSFDIPNLAEDRTVNALTLHCPITGSPFQVVVSRDELIGGEDLVVCIKRQVRMMTRHVSNFRELARREIFRNSNGLQALEIESAFRQANSNYYQVQAVIITRPPSLLVLTLSNQTPLREPHRETWATILDTYRLREVIQQG